MMKKMTVLLFVLFSLLGRASGEGYRITGETFALKGIEEKQFYYIPLVVQRVYQYNSSGEVIEYIENVDYVLDYEKGTICRTNNSRIPDYNKHVVKYNNDGKFSFVSDPRNPELNIEYQIMTDYITSLPQPVKVYPKEGLNKTIQILKNGDNIRVILCGDSIASGAHTTGSYYFGDHIRTTFLGCLKSFLENCYGIEVDARSFSKDGTTLFYLKDNIDVLIDLKPDIVLIEFGMNDHVADYAMSEKGKADFSWSLNKCVQMLKNEGIDVILIGFFQQNDDWEKENTEATVFYNGLIEQVASENEIPFVDVYSRFSRLSQKNISEDITSDYMHHPTDFGHKIYFSEIIPYFLDQEMETVGNYIY